MQTTIYLSGKITDDPDYQGKFAYFEHKLAKAGYTVINPARLPEGLSKAEYMMLNFADIIRADAVLFLPDHTQSPGALLENDFARYIGKKRFYALDELGAAG